MLYSLQPHCSYVNRANISQASRGFVSDSWAFLFDLRCTSQANVDCQVEIDPQGALCCDGIVYRRRRGTEQHCCGRVAYDENRFACCGPADRRTVIQRSPVMPACCDARSNIECSTAGKSVTDITTAREQHKISVDVDASSSRNKSLKYLTRWRP